MNLQQTKEALEQNDIAVALDVGVHRHCDINSNCPLAVELRRVIHDSGTTLEQLLTGFAESQGSPPDPLADPQITGFDGRTTVQIGGNTVEIDLTQALEEGTKRALEDRILDLRNKQSSIVRLGNNLYSTYLNQIWELRNSRTLPQLEFSTIDLVRANCLITTDGANYIFLLARDYNPQWVVTNGVRYKIADEDILAIVRKAYIQFTITVEHKIISTLILDSGGEKLYHYHGNAGDCWGNFTMPERWDGTLRSLTNLTTQIMGALATINKDSLMEHTPHGMLGIEGVFERSTKLGEEGHMEERVQPAGGWGEGTTQGDTDGTPRRWGQRRRTQPDGATPLLDEEGEYLRRWGTRGVPEDGDIICALCGETYWQHTDYHCPGREHTMIFERFGVEEVPVMDTTCILCGRTYEEHYGTPPDIRCRHDIGGA